MTSLRLFSRAPRMEMNSVMGFGGGEDGPRTSLSSQASTCRNLLRATAWRTSALKADCVNCFSFVDVDRAAYVSVEARVEETGRILQRRALGEGQLHGFLVGFAGADDPVVRPDRNTPLPFLDDVRVCFLDELAHSAEGFPAPVGELGDSFRDELRGRLALARGGLFHDLLPLRHLAAYGSMNKYRPLNRSKASGSSGE